MKKLFTILLVALLSCNMALADCDWKKDIAKVDAAHYSYTIGCHIQVGQTLQDLGNAQITIEELNKSIKLKDDALLLADQRVDLWKTTSGKLEDRLNQVQRLERRNMFLYIGVGVIASGLAVYSIKRLRP